MQNPVLFGFIMLYLGVTIAIGWWASRRVHNTADFVVAGKSLPLFMASCALFATWFGSETVMGASSKFVEGGILGVIEDPFGASLCLLLAGLLVARPLYSRNLLTFSDFYRRRFNRTAEIVSAVVMVPSYFSWISAQLVALAIILQSVSGLDRTYGVLICTSMVLFYTYIGGMWSVTVTDFVQTIVIIVGLLILAAVMLMRVGGFGKMAAAAPPDFFRFLPEAKPVNVIQWFAAWMTIGLGSIPQQDVFQRVMAARSVRTSVLSCYVSSFMYITVAALPLMIAFCARILYPETMQGDTQMMLPNMVMQHFGLGMQILFFGALLSAVLSTASGALLAPATVVGENLVKPLFSKVTDAQLLRIMRISLVCVALITGGMALSRNDIYELVGESSAFSLVSLFVPLIAGLYWRRASAAGAVLAMLLGLAAWFAAIWILPDEAYLSANPEAPVWQHIPPMMYGLAASFAAMWAGSLLWPRSEEFSWDSAPTPL